MVREAVAAKKAPAKKAAAKKAPAKKAAPRKRAVPRAAAPPAIVDPYERARRAHKLLIEGGDWDFITTQLEYASIEAATLDVRTYLSYVHTMTQDDERGFARRLQLDQLTKLLGSWFPLAADMRDKDAATVVLKTMDQQAKLMDLYDLNQRQGSSQTIIVTGGDDMAGELMRIAMEAAAGEQALDDVVEAEVVD